jgi:hypothetical protein
MMHFQGTGKKAPENAYSLKSGDMLENLPPIKITE